MHSETSAATVLQQLSLTAEAVIDTPPQRISAMQQWAPGTVVPLTCAVDGEQVRLRVNGHAMARGRLVAVGDALGIEIVELYP